MARGKTTLSFSVKNCALLFVALLFLSAVAAPRSLLAQGVPVPPSASGMIPGGIYPVGQGPVGVGIYGPPLGTAYNFSGTVNNTDNSSVTHWINPNGWFYGAKTYKTGFDPSAVAYGYLDKTAYPFMVVTDHHDDTLALFQLTDGLTFVQVSVIGSGGTGPAGLTFADFNGDGNMDIAVINDDASAAPGGPNVAIFLGNGNATFHKSDRAAASIPISYTPLSLATGDLNGDGKPDLIVASYAATLGKAGSQSASGGVIQVFLGKGDGTFQAPSSIIVGQYPSSVVVADFNGDGKMDLAIADYIAGNVAILLGKGDGTFQPPITYPADSGPFSLVAADFNGDGKMDLAVANFNSNDVSILFGNGDGTFGAPQNIGVGNGPVSIAKGDFNGDGKTDLVVANFYDNTISTLMNVTGCPASSLFNATLPAGTEGTAYSQSLAASGLLVSTNFVISGGQLPSGMSLSTAGLLTGTSNSAGTYNFTVTGLVNNACPGAENYSLAIHGSTVARQINPGGASTAITMGGTQPVESGYATITMSSGNPPYATAVFSLRQNGFVVSEAGVPASPPTTKGEFFVDFRNNVSAKTDQDDSGTISVDTGVAAVNRGNATANITYTLKDTSGNVVVTGHGTLTAGAHFAKFIDQLNTVAADFVLPGNFATLTQFGSLTIQSDQPLSIQALRLTVNQRGDTLITSTPIADLNKAAQNGPSYFPQLADGGGWTTKIILLNTTTATETGQLQLFGDGGSPLIVHQVGGATNSSFAYNIPAGGVFIFQTDGSPANAVSGQVQLTPDSGMKTPVGAGVFSFSPGGTLVTEAGVPASPPTTHARIYIDTSGGHLTGLALANPSGSPENITLAAYQLDGSTFVSLGALPLAANGHKAAFTNSFVAGLPNGFTGVLDISSPTPFVALTLRALNNGRDQIYTTVPVADLTQPAPSPIVFPQIADGIGGGQYQTQFIILSAGDAESFTLSFFGDDGTPLVVGKRVGN